MDGEAGSLAKKSARLPQKFTAWAEKLPCLPRKWPHLAELFSRLPQKSAASPQMLTRLSQKSARSPKKLVDKPEELPYLSQELTCFPSLPTKERRVSIIANRQLLSDRDIWARDTGGNMVILRAAIGFALLLACTSRECLLAPCALVPTVSVNVSSTTGLIIHNATIQVSGAVTSSISCDGSCGIVGPVGTYVLSVTAPGYQTTQRTVAVMEPPAGSCQCAGPNEHVEVALTPAS